MVKAKKFKDSYSPYGAFELKAKYQRNMLFGTFMTTAFVVVLVGGIWIATAHSAVDVVLGGGPPNETKVILDEPPTVVPDQQKRIVKPKANFEPGKIPEPVADEELIDEDEIEMITNDEFEVFGTADSDADESNGNDGSEFYGNYDGEYFPSEGEFEFVEIMPEMIYEVMPEYPRLAKRAGLEGKVYIKVLISKDGEVIKAEIFHSSEHTILDNAALSVAKQNKFKPGIQNGRSVNVWVTYKVDFVLSN